MNNNGYIIIVFLFLYILKKNLKKLINYYWVYYIDKKHLILILN